MDELKRLRARVVQAPNHADDIAAIRSRLATLGYQADPREVAVAWQAWSDGLLVGWDDPALVSDAEFASFVADFMEPMPGDEVVATLGRWLLFVLNTYERDGGWGDFLSDHASAEEALAEGRRIRDQAKAEHLRDCMLSYRRQNQGRSPSGSMSQWPDCQAATLIQVVDGLTGELIEE